jgi:hypothetical protein
LFDIKLNMAAQELRPIRDPRGPEGEEQLSAALVALDAARCKALTLWESELIITTPTQGGLLDPENEFCPLLQKLG